LGKDGYPYIMDIPARDLTLYDLHELSIKFNLSVEAVVDWLCHPPSGVALYTQQQAEFWICEICSKEYKTWEGYHKHTLTHVEANDEFITSVEE
jgi:hypothetical protein